MRKVFIILLLLTFFLSQLGYYLIYGIKLYQAKEQARREIISSIPDNYFDIICLEDNSSKITWKEKGEEFSFQGKMYDVARIKKNNGKTFLYCYNDSREEKLIAGFSKKIDSDNNPGNKQHISKSNPTDWINTGQAIALPIPLTTSNTSTYYDFAEPILSLSKEVTSPPPDLDFIPKKNYLIYSPDQASNFRGFPVRLSFYEKAAGLLLLFTRLNGKYRHSCFHHTSEVQNSINAPPRSTNVFRSTDLFIKKSTTIKISKR